MVNLLQTFWGFRYGATLSILMSALLFFVSIHFVQAQVETVGPVDTNSQEPDTNDDDTDEEDSDRDLTKSKYAPTGLTTVALGETTVRMTWTDNAKEETGYDAQRRPADGVWRTIARLESNQESYDDIVAVAGTSYEYRVRAFDSNNPTSWSNISGVTTPGLSPDDVARQEQEVAVQEAKQAIEAAAEEKIRIATIGPKNTSSNTECSVDDIAQDDLDAHVRAKCELLTGQDLSDGGKANGQTTMATLMGNSKVRMLLAGLVLFLLVNNVAWHITHKTVKKRLAGQR